MKISVALATCNGARYLSEQLDSLARQTRRPDELVVTDDASGDGTLALLQAFARTAPFEVRIVANVVTLGYAQNFGRAFASCTGDLVLPCDQDDAWLATKIETMVVELTRRPGTSLLLCDAMLADAGLMPSGQTKLGLIRAHGLPDTAHVMGCCMAVRRPLLELALPIPRHAHAHDNWIAQIADELGLSERLDRPLQCYRRHGANASTFFVNRAGRPSTLAVQATRLRRVARRFVADGGMRDEHRLLGLVLARLRQRPADAVALVGETSYRAAVASLSWRLETLARRLAIRGQPRLRRPAAILSLWRAGGYAQAGRLAGALKDLAIARSTGGADLR